jgi:hypothetical protein
VAALRERRTATGLRWSIDVDPLDW